jgi:hypothetical protein
MGTKHYTSRLNANDPEGAYLLGRFEAWEELVSVLRDAAKLLRMRGEGPLDAVQSVEHMLRGIVQSHDRMVESISEGTYSPGANEAKARHAELLGPVAAMDGDVGDLPDFDPDAQDNPYAMPEED